MKTTDANGLPLIGNPVEPIDDDLARRLADQLDAMAATA